jgi:transcriptional regulator with XRE-family HTH domain
MLRHDQRLRGSAAQCGGSTAWDGLAIKELREGRGLTQEELASRADTTIGTISRLESAKSAPAWATVMQAIDAMDVSLAE